MPGANLVPFRESSAWRRGRQSVVKFLRARLQHPSWTVAIATALVATLLLATPLGRYLDEAIFETPFQRLRAAIGAQPHLAGEVRVVLLDDQSLKHLGRPLRFDEWLRIAATLKAQGFDRILLHEPQNLALEIGSPEAIPADVLVATGAVDTLGFKSSRSVAFADLPRTKLIPEDRGVAAAKPATRVLAAHEDAWRRIESFGHVNVYDRSTFPLAFRGADGFVMPHLALYAAGGIPEVAKILERLGAGRLAAARSTQHVEFVPLRSILERAVSVLAFLSDRKVVDAWGEISAAARKKLEGGRIAVLVPAAFTGSRNWESPVEGSLPAYAQFLSIVTQVLRERFLYAPLPAAWLVLGILPFVILIATRRMKIAALLYAATLCAVVGAGSSLRQAQHVLLPVAELCVVVFAAVLTRFAHHLLVVTRERLELDAQLDLGMAVQSLLLPAQRRGTAGQWEYAVSFRPYGPMSGDWMQIFARDHVEGVGPVLVIAIGDAVGKGASAALVTSAIAAIWRRCESLWERGGIDAVAFLTELGTVIHSTYRGQQNSTISLAVVLGDHVELFGAGAPRWLRLVPRGDSGTIRDVPRNPLGVGAPKYGRGWSTTDVQDGTIFVAYTDGVLEGSLPRSAFLREARAIVDAESGETFAALEAAALAAGSGSALPDDITVLFLRRMGRANVSGEARRPDGEGVA